MRNLTLIIISLFLISFNHALSQDFTQELINKIVLDSLINSVEELSGAKRVLINGVDTIIQKRKFRSDGNVVASQYLFEKGENYHYEVNYQKCSETCTNVIWERKGVIDSNQVVIIGAHYDSDNFDDFDGKSEFLSPGADDNASGCAAIMEIARLLESYQPDYTIKFIFWDEEEVGSSGSKFYAKNAKESEQKILFYLNLDMLAWDENNDGLFRLKYIDTASSSYLADSVIAICGKYQLNLDPIKQTYKGSYIGFTGDADWFWYYGFSAVGLADYVDYFSAYHSHADRINLFNKEYFLENTKLALAILLRFGYNEITTNIEKSNQEIKTVSVYPNPATDFIEINVGARHAVPLREIRIYNVLGEMVLNLTPALSKGEGVRIDVNKLPPGVYFVMVGYIVRKFVKI